MFKPSASPLKTTHHFLGCLFFLSPTTPKRMHHIHHILQRIQWIGQIFGVKELQQIYGLTAPEQSHRCQGLNSSSGVMAWWHEPWNPHGFMTGSMGSLWSLFHGLWYNWVVSSPRKKTTQIIKGARVAQLNTSWYGRRVEGGHGTPLQQKLHFCCSICFVFHRNTPSHHDAISVQKEALKPWRW